jgi:predicted O-linked N-acetylglucosamine transferase (SPINDLY family)
LNKVDALFARAIAFDDGGKPDQALACYAELLSAAPDHADALHNRGLLLARLGRIAEAEESHRAYVHHHPQSARARGDLADVLLAQAKYEAALDAVTRSADLQEPALLLRRGIALSCLRRLEEARQDFDRARALSPAVVDRFIRRAAQGADPAEMLSPENIFLERSYAALGESQWSAWDGHVAAMREAAVRNGAVLEPAVAYMALHAPLDGKERHSVARRVAARLESRISPLAAPGARRAGRTRVGVLSPDFRDHVVGYMLLPLLELTDSSRFQWFAYSLGADDGSAIRRQLVQAADAFRDLQRLSDDEAAAAIRNDDIDVLLDVCGYMAGGRFGITLRRPARIQVSYAGFSGSLGSERVDFAIVDPIVAPDPEEWTETPIYMPGTFYLYDFRRPAPSATVSRGDYGLPNDAFVFCAFHSAQKTTPDTFALWMEVLRRVPNSMLWFRALSEGSQRRLRSAAAAQGVAATRLVFAPFEPNWNPRYLARHRLGDLLLDALHHNAITNACDALGMGLPTLTVRGASMATRAGESLLRAAGLPELVATDRDDFVRAAVRLAAEPERIARYRERLQRRDAPLFDTAARVREIEACLEEIIQVSDQRRSRL